MGILVRYYNIDYQCYCKTHPLNYEHKKVACYPCYNWYFFQIFSLFALSTSCGQVVSGTTFSGGVRFGVEIGGNGRGFAL
jgi:hypothetical protein